MEEVKYLRCYNRWTTDKRRMSIFCRKINEDTLEIFTLKCSPKDTFRKVYANLKYQEHLTGLEDELSDNIEHIKIQSGDTMAYTFSRYLRQNYWKKVVARSCETWEIPLSCRIRTYISPIGNHDYVEITKLIRK